MARRCNLALREAWYQAPPSASVIKVRPEQTQEGSIHLDSLLSGLTQHISLAFGGGGSNRKIYRWIQGHVFYRYMCAYVNRHSNIAS